jgi:hypothetical protein
MDTNKTQRTIKGRNIKETEEEKSSKFKRWKDNNFRREGRELEN